MHNGKIRLRSRATVLVLCASIATAAAAHAQSGPFQLPDDHFLCYKGRVEKGDLVVPSGL
jgi:hypothetical protein